MAYKSVADLWRQLSLEKRINVTQPTFYRWAKTLGLDYAEGLDKEAEEKLINYACLVRHKVAETRYRAKPIENKMQVLQALILAKRLNPNNQQEEVRGSDILQIASVHNAATRPTIYNRAAKLGFSFSAHVYYSFEVAKNLVLGLGK